MNESTIQVLNPSSIGDACATVASYLSQQAWENAAGERLQWEVVIQPVTNQRVRTPTQNNCIHKYCDMLAKDLNDAGYERVITSPVLSQPLTVPWCKENVKSDIWHTVQLAYCKVTSSADLTTTQCSQIYEIIARRMAEAFGVTTAWPTRFGG